MAAYAYSAINAQGVVLSGEISANDLSAAREQLRIKGLLAQSLQQIDDGESNSGVGALKKGVNAKSLQIFSRQFATMIEAGLNVVSALAGDPTQRPSRASALAAVRRAARTSSRTPG